MTGNKVNFKKRTLNRIFPTLLISIALPFIVCLCIPFEIYGNNLDEFLFSVSGFLPFSLLFTLLITAIFFFSIIFLPQKAYKICSAILLALSFMFFLQGTYLNAGLTSLAGDNLGTKTITSGQKIFNVILWVIVIVLAIILSLFKDKNGIIATVGVILSAVILVAQLSGPLTLALSTDGVFKDKEDRVASANGSASHILTTKDLTTVSTGKNIFYFCVDRFDQKYANQAYEECPEVFDVLDGFTAFDDNLSVYGHTFPGIANLLTTEQFDCNKSRADFLNDVYTENNTLDVLNENGYTVNLFTQPYYAYTDASYLPDYVANVSKATTYEVIGQPMLPLTMMQISLYRCFPLILKPLVGNVTSASCNNYVFSQGENGFSQYSTDMKSVWENISTATFKTTDKNLFTFIHIEGCHGVDYDEEWNKASLSESKDVMISLRNSFDIIGVYLKALKDLGVYDNSTIIITGDHADPVDDASDLDDVRLTALYVKPSGSASVALKRSKAQVCHDNVWPTIFKSENITQSVNQNKTVFEVDESVNVPRYYIWQTYDATLNEYIYSINGAGNDFNNWKLEKENYYDKFIMD